MTFFLQKLSRQSAKKECFLCSDPDSFVFRETKNCINRLVLLSVSIEEDAKKIAAHSEFSSGDLSQAKNCEKNEKYIDWKAYLNDINDLKCMTPYDGADDWP